MQTRRRRTRREARRAVWARLGLLALLLAAAATTGGILFAKHELETVRTLVEDRIAERVGARFRTGGVSIDGLSALRVQDVEAWVALPSGVDAHIRVPSCRIVINLTDLISGALSMQRIEVNDARVTVSKSRRTPSQHAAATGLELAAGASGAAFRVLGEQCRIEFKGLWDGPDVVLDEIAFDVSRLSDATDIAGKISGTVAHAAADAPPAFHADVLYGGPQDFNVRAECDGLTRAAIGALFPEASRILRSGGAQAKLRIDGYPNRTVMLHVQTRFEDVAIQNQPSFLPPLSGSLTALANYDIETRELTLDTALLHTMELTGRLDGRISFAAGPPHVDLALSVEDLPLAEALSSALPLQLEGLGALAFALDEAGGVRVYAVGAASDLAVTAEARLGAGTFTFQPDKDTLPTATLSLGGATVAWSSTAGVTGGSASVTGGTIAHEKAGIRAQNITGQLKIGDGVLTVDPINLQLTGNPFVGRVRYVIEERRGSFEAQGTLANIERTLLGKGIKETEIAGSASARCTGTFEPDHYVLDLAVDATQAAIEHDWWFYKRAGVGATLHGVNVDIVPRKRIRMSGAFAVGTSTGNATIEMAYHNGRYRLMASRAKADRLDVVEVGQCIRIPYTISGGSGMDGFFEWKRAGDQPDAAVIDVGGRFDEIAFLPQGSEKPVVARDASVRVTLHNEQKEDRTAVLRVTVGDGRMPPFDEPWLLPLRTDPVLLEKYPEQPRSWTFDVAVDRLAAPPWKGTQFTATGAFDDDHTDIQAFSAQVGSGDLKGSYRLEKAENLSHTRAQWRDIPASMLIDHIHLPRVLEGRLTGEIDYQIDRDDPGTLAGTGSFNFRDGEFSADFLFAQFQEFLGGDLTTLPPSLRFSELDFDVRLDGDRVHTSNMRLVSKGIIITGEGHIALGADMDYLINVVLSPDVAARMPVFTDYFNVAGHRLSQNDIALTFRITGPTFKPSGEVVGLPPLGVTVVSGAAELGTEAFRVLDTPRQVLIDLFRIGGAIVGVGR